VADYTRADARAWAREHLVGCSGVTIPTFTADLARLNEDAIRHDIELVIEHGFTYTLLMTETAITPEEAGRFTAIAREAAGGRLRLIAHSAFGTLEDNVKALRLAEQEGADLVLLAYPPQFWPTTHQEVYDWTRAVCEATNLGVMLFGLPAWGFERIHPAGMPVDFVRHVLDTLPTIVAIKSEQGYPLVAGMCEMYHHFRDEVVISCPIESDAIPLMSVMDLQFSGTSNTQWMSDWYPRTFELACSGHWPEAMERYWRVQPARLAASAATQAYIGGTSVLNRTMWKYQDWLAGYNGGPLRAPAMRIPDRLMKSLRSGLEAAGLPVTSDSDSQFMIGRNPA
jgi:dihydrodipicolinate synthase/N-acetylneuraminate lyase